MTKTTPETAAAWADAQVRRHTSWPLDILGTGPRCVGNCHQGRALCVHPEACGVQKPVLLAPAEELQRDEGEPGDGKNWTPVFPPGPIGWLVKGVCIVLGVALGLHIAAVRGWLS